MLQSLIGPAIVAAVISALVTAAGWFATYKTSLGIEKEKRRERVRDFQVALRAEIRSELHNLDDENLTLELEKIEQSYAKSKDYSVFVPSLAKHIVFESLVRDIHVLPESVIDPLILYTRQRQLLDQFAADMRSDRFLKITQNRQIEMYRDYVGVTRYLKILANDAVTAIDLSLAEKKIQ